MSNAISYAIAVLIMAKEEVEELRSICRKNNTVFGADHDIESKIDSAINVLEEDADHIVKAANAHEALVEALEYSINVADYLATDANTCADGVSVMARRGAVNSMQEARATLALVKGGE